MGLTSLKTLAVVLLGSAFATVVSAQTNQAVYTDSLQNGWAGWGWANSINFANTSVVLSNSAGSISVAGGGDQALYLHHDAWDSTAFTNISFYINGGASGGQRLRLQATLNGVAQPGYSIGPLAANSWQFISVSLATLGVAGNPNFDGFWIQDTSGSAFPTFYVDNIVLKAGDPLPPPPPPPPLGTNFISVDVAANRRAISPEIYGVAIASTSQLSDLNAPLNRSGGNTTSRYNWQANADNRGSDWFFESIGYESSAPGQIVDSFIGDTKSAGAQPMVTIPMLDWVAKLGPGRSKLSSFSVSKYGAQEETDFWMPDAGNGVRPNGSLVTGNDPNDANTPSTSTFQQGWVQHLTNTWHAATNGGVRYYLLDNEATLWHSTHRDVQPTGITMEQMRNKMIDYIGKIRAIDPNATIVGPEEWGWSGYFYSGLDQQTLATNGYSFAPDKAAHGNKDYLPWLLEQLRQTNLVTGKKLLDVFSVHYYPQEKEFISMNGNDVSATAQLQRNRSTRSLWDTNYTDTSWIGAKVMLIPRMKNWVSAYYPGLRTAITEYNWGAEGHMNGATAQADILGIFGREGLDIATRWTTPTNTSPAYKAMKIYRNYDGNKSTFGDTSVLATSTNVDNVAVFAAQRTNDGALTIMVINKYLSNSVPVSLKIANFGTNGTAQVWQLNTNAISPLPNLSYTNSVLDATLPAQSVTLFLLPVTTPARLKASRNSSQVDVTLNGQIGATYILQSSSNLTSWLNVSTNTLTNLQLNLPLSATNSRTFYRAQKAP